LQISNTKEPSTPKNENGGIGLKNVKRRLDLIYGDRYQLHIQDTMDHYSVTLEMPVL
jgi:sensor histidine kinase YesM